MISVRMGAYGISPPIWVSHAYPYLPYRMSVLGIWTSHTSHRQPPRCSTAFPHPQCHLTGAFPRHRSH